jgi:hypothetical protein
MVIRVFLFAASTPVEHLVTVEQFLCGPTLLGRPPLLLFPFEFGSIQSLFEGFSALLLRVLHHSHARYVHDIGIVYELVVSFVIGFILFALFLDD